MVLVTAPRVVSPGEKVSLPVSLFIQKEGIRDVSVKAQSNDIMAFDDDTRNIKIQGTGEKDTEFSFVAGEKRGVATIKVTATVEMKRQPPTIWNLR